MISTAVLRGLVPPVLWNVLRHLRPAGPTTAPLPPQFEIVSEGFPDGWSEVTGIYDTPAVVAGHRAKWPRFRALVDGTGALGVSHESDLSTRDDLATHNTVMSFAYVAARTARDGRLSILDWGGGPGHYALFARAVLPGVEVAYASRDLPAIAALGPDLLPEDRFFGDDRCFDERYDLVVASGSMHYVPEWQGTFRRLAGAARRSLFVTRFPITEGPSFVYVQRVPEEYGYGAGLTIYGWCLGREAFLAEAAAAGFHLAREFVVGEDWQVAGAPSPCLVRGFLFDRAGDEPGQA